jgi:ABC-type nitrate/sulfonate/bicarbonate transport system permease component
MPGVGDVRSRGSGWARGGALPALAAGLVILLAWAVLAHAMRNSTLLPDPLSVAGTLGRLLASGALFQHAGASLGRIFLAWSLAVAIAIPLGVAMGRSERMDRFVRPFVELFRPISPLAWIPLAVLWFGIGLGGKVFIIVIGSFFPALLNTIAGVKGVPPIFITAARTFGCSPLQLTTRVCLPAALPTIATGLRISFGTAWMTIIAAEMVASRSGLGHMIVDGMEILRSDIVIVGMAVIGVLGFAFASVFRGVEEWLKDR